LVVVTRLLAGLSRIQSLDGQKSFFKMPRLTLGPTKPPIQWMQQFRVKAAMTLS